MPPSTSTVASQLNDNIISDKALEAFVDEMAPIRAFAHDFSPAIAEKGASVTVPLLENLAADDTENDYETASGGMAAIPVAIDRYRKVTVGLTDRQFHESSAARLERFAFQQVKALARAVQVDMFGIITAANYPALIECIEGALTSGDVRTIRKKMNVRKVPKTDRTLFLGSEQYDDILGDTTVNLLSALHYGGTEAIREGMIPRYLGFDIHESQLIPDNGQDLIGFAAHPAAMAVAVRGLMPQEPGEYLESRLLTDDASGLTIGYRRHYAAGKGIHYCTFECLYGRAKGLATALERIVEIEDPGEGGGEG